MLLLSQSRQGGLIDLFSHRAGKPSGKELECLFRDMLSGKAPPAAAEGHSYTKFNLVWQICKWCSVVMGVAGDPVFA